MRAPSQRQRRRARSTSSKRFLTIGERRQRRRSGVRDVEPHQMHRTRDVRDEIEARRIVPAQGLHRDRRALGNIARFTRSRVDEINVAAGRSEVAHDAADDRDAAAVGRPLRIVDLIRRREEVAHRAAFDVDPRKARDPPVVVAVSLRIRYGDLSSIGRPAVFVDVRIGGCHEMQRAVCDVNRRETLLVNGRADDADVACARRERAGLSMRASDTTAPPALCLSATRSAAQRRR